MIIWPALVALFAWPVLHRACGGLILWSDHELWVGERVIAGTLAWPDGSPTKPGDEYGRCPSCGRLFGGYGLKPGWTSSHEEGEKTIMSQDENEHFKPEPLAPAPDWIQPVVGEVSRLEAFREMVQRLHEQRLSTARAREDEPLLPEYRAQLEEMARVRGLVPVTPFIITPLTADNTSVVLSGDVEIPGVVTGFRRSEEAARLLER